MLINILDAIPWWVLVLGVGGILLGASEAAFRFGRRPHRDPEIAKHRKAQAHIVVAALLALLGLLLAFSFNIVESRFLGRKKLVLQEANAIGTTYLRADMLPSPQRERLHELLREYVRQRLAINDPSHAQKALEESAELHDDMWAEADAVVARQKTPIDAIFVESLNNLIDLQEERETVALHERLPGAIFLTLVLVSVLAMAVLGYSSSLGGARALPGTIALIIATTTVLVLILNLDKPWERLFAVDKHALLDAKETMDKQDRASAARAARPRPGGAPRAQ